MDYSREDLVSGRVHWTDLTPAEWRAHDEQAMADLKATRTAQTYQKGFFRKDGSRVPVLAGAALFEEGNDGVWNQIGAVAAIVVPPAFYRTVGLQGLCACAALGLPWRCISCACANCLRKCTAGWKNGWQSETVSRGNCTTLYCRAFRA